MTREPRFLVVQDNLYMVSVTWKYGALATLDGPYQCVGAPGLTTEQFVQQISQLMRDAANKPTLAISDLPEAVRAQVEADLAAKAS